MLERIKRFLTDNQILIVLVGLLAGLFFPEFFLPLHGWNTFLLQCVFFLSALRINLRDVKEYALDWKMQLMTTVFMLIVLPLAVYLPLTFIMPEWSLAFLIALAGPTGMTIALIADFFHGKPTLALVISVITSLVAPFTMPLLFHTLLGASIKMNPMFMLRELFTAIVIPFFLAFLVDRFAPIVVKKGADMWRTLSIAIFGLLIASIVSKTAGGAGDSASLHLSLHNVILLTMTFFYVGFLIWISYKMVYWRNVGERVTVALSMMYMNFTLALYVGDQFFAAQNVVPQLVVIVLLLDAMLPLLKVFAGKFIEEHAPSAKNRGRQT
jgi:predicted Na+-dependent transporter